MSESVLNEEKFKSNIEYLKDESLFTKEIDYRKVRGILGLQFLKTNIKMENSK